MTSLSGSKFRFMLAHSLSEIHCQKFIVGNSSSFLPCLGQLSVVFYFLINFRFSLVCNFIALMMHIFLTYIVKIAILLYDFELSG